MLAAAAPCADPCTAGRREGAVGAILARSQRLGALSRHGRLAGARRRANLAVSAQHGSNPSPPGGAGGPSACQSGAQQSVEERARQQRLMHSLLCAERQRRDAVAATAGHAYRAVMQQRERQRRAAADEQEALRAEWAAASPAAGSRHGTHPGGRGQPADAGSGGASYPVGMAGVGAGTLQWAARRRQDSRFWMLYATSYRRLYGGGPAPSDADDLWGRMSAAAAGATGTGGPAAGQAGSSSSANGSSGGGWNFFRGAAGAGQEPGSAHASGGGGRHAWFSKAAAAGAFAYWRGFASQAASGRFGFGQAGGHQQQQGQQHSQQQHGNQQHAQQQQHAHHRAGAPPHMPPGVGAPLAGASVEAQVRAELAALLAASGGDLVHFVSALGIPFERGPDRRRTLKNARRAAVRSLHPDTAAAAADERQQAWAHHSTMLVNELWRASLGPH